jgi:hypothetical protein
MEVRADLQLMSSAEHKKMVSPPTLKELLGLNSFGQLALLSVV